MSIKANEEQMTFMSVTDCGFWTEDKPIKSSAQKVKDLEAKNKKLEAEVKRLKADIASLQRILSS